MQNYITTHNVNNFDAHEFTSALSAYCKEHKISVKELFTLVRIALTGLEQGPNVKDLLTILSPADIFTRFEALLQVS